MKLPTASVTTIALVLILVCSLGSAAYTRKQLLDQQVNHPSSTPFRADRCKAKGLVAHWKFGEVHDAALADSSGNENHGVFGTPLSPLAQYRFPRFIEKDGAFDFQGHQWILAENSACFASEEISVLAWVWMESPAYAPTIAGKSSWPFDGWWLMTTSIRPQGRDRFLSLGVAYGSGLTHVETDYQLPLHEWHHVGVSMDNNRQEVQFFVDGKPYGNKHTQVHKWLANYSSPFTLAAYDGTGRWPWHGKIDDVRVYNRVVSNEEAQSAYLLAKNKL